MFRTLKVRYNGVLYRLLTEKQAREFWEEFHEY